MDLKKIAMVLAFFGAPLLISAEATVKVASTQLSRDKLTVQTVLYTIQKDKFKKYQDLTSEPLSYYDIQSFQLIRPRLKKGLAESIYFSVGGRLFEEVELLLKSGQKKKVAQLILQGNGGLLKGESQSLGSKTCRELGQLFSGGLPPEIKNIKVTDQQLKLFLKGQCA